MKLLCKLQLNNYDVALCSTDFTFFFYIYFTQKHDIKLSITVQCFLGWPVQCSYQFSEAWTYMIHLRSILIFPCILYSIVTFIMLYANENVKCVTISFVLLFNPVWLLLCQIDLCIDYEKLGEAVNSPEKLHRSDGGGCQCCNSHLWIIPLGGECELCKVYPLSWKQLLLLSFILALGIQCNDSKFVHSYTMWVFCI